MIRLFVGADCNNGDLESQAVLEYTARKYCSEPLDITWMQLAHKGPWSGWNMDAARTPFTPFRWGVPEAAGFEGRAIYTDSDFIFRADLAELWHQEMPGDVAILMRDTEGKLKTCAMLFDCAKMRAHLPIDLKGRVDNNDYMVNYCRTHRQILRQFDGAWNSIDLAGVTGLDDPRLKAIHYSRMEVQPQLKYAIPRLAAKGLRHWYDGEIGTHWRQDLIDLFDAELAAAIAAGYPPERYERKPFGPFNKKSFAGRPAITSRA